MRFNVGDKVRFTWDGISSEYQGKRIKILSVTSGREPYFIEAHDGKTYYVAERCLVPWAEELLPATPRMSEHPVTSPFRGSSFYPRDEYWDD